MEASREIILVIKDDVQTQLMQNFDVFEKFKFVGQLLEATQTASYFHLTPAEVLERSVAHNGHGFSTVGVIIPSVGSAFLPNHSVYSTGEKWIPVEDLCLSYAAPLPQEPPDPELIREFEEECHRFHTDLKHRKSRRPPEEKK